MEIVSVKFGEWWIPYTPENVKTSRIVMSHGGKLYCKGGSPPTPEKWMVGKLSFFGFRTYFQRLALVLGFGEYICYIISVILLMKSCSHLGCKKPCK